MKKIFLLGALVCVGQMYGMEPMEPENSYELLPKELKQGIINNALATSKNVNQVINAIKAFGALHGMHYDTQTATDLLVQTLPDNLDEAIDEIKNLQETTLEDFTQLVHLLADKFNMTTQKIAKKFTMPIAETYLNFGSWLLEHMKDRGAFIHTKVINLIKKGADVNYSGVNFSCNGAVYEGSPLGLAIANLNVAAIKTLLRFGVKISDEDLSMAASMSEISKEKIKRRHLWAKGDEALIIYKLLLEAQIKAVEEKLNVTKK